MAISPSRLDPMRVTIVPTATAGKSKSVLITEVHVSVAKTVQRSLANCQDMIQIDPALWTINFQLRETEVEIKDAIYELRIYQKIVPFPKYTSNMIS